MKLSTRARYGLRICFLMGISSDVVSLSSLGSQTDLSEKYLEQLLAMLKRAGIVEAKRGKNGGYALTRPPSKITADEILTALDDNFDITDCVHGSCDDEYCPNKVLFSRIYKDVKNVLVTTSLQTIIDDSSLCAKGE